MMSDIFEMIELFAMFGAGFVLSLGTMLITWLIYLFNRKANVVDVAWVVAFCLSAWAYLLIGEGYAPKRWLVTAMVTIWAIRLGQYLFERLLNTPEDPRYAFLRAKWGGDKSNILFLMMFLLQGALVVILSLPCLLISYGATPEWTLSDIFGVLIWAFGLAGESLADYQLARFKADAGNEGKIMKSGFWRYSRHPNYFFEWVIWVGFFLFAFSSPGGVLAVLSPIIMYGLLTKGSGVPLNEEQALRSKGEAYRQYQLTTSPFFPWFPSREEPLPKLPDNQNITPL